MQFCKISQFIIENIMPEKVEPVLSKYQQPGVLTVLTANSREINTHYEISRDLIHA